MTKNCADPFKQTEGSAIWENHVTGLLNNTHIFFKNGVMMEQGCENVKTCDTDQLSFKAYFSSWLASTTTLAPFTSAQIFPLLASTSKAVAQVCNGGANGRLCGFRWTQAPTNDGNVGVGQQMSALAAIQSAMVQIPGKKVIAPLVTTTTGGTSKGDASAGINSQNQTEAMLLNMEPVATRDRVAAGILTFAVATTVVGGSVFMIM